VGDNDELVFVISCFRFSCELFVVFLFDNVNRNTAPRGINGININHFERPFSYKYHHVIAVKNIRQEIAAVICTTALLTFNSGFEANKIPVKYPIINGEIPYDSAYVQFKCL
jgi:hypothetical protein